MKRNSALDLARVVSMLAVIMIHVTSAYIGYRSGFMLWGMNLAFVLNQATRFAVPLFVLLSGVSLGLSGEQLRPAAFYRKRLWKIGAPYLVWSGVYLAYKGCFTPGAAPLTVSGVLRALLLGTASDHLYFIVILLQLYFLYPLLRKWTDAAPLAVLTISVVVTCCTQHAVTLRKYSLIPAVLRPHLWLLFPAWLVFFTAGICLTPPRLRRVTEVCRRHAALLVLCAAVFAVLYALESHITGSLSSVRPKLLLYTPLIFAALLGAGSRLTEIPALGRAVEFLSAHSMTIYFCHVLVLQRLRLYGIFYRGMSGMVLLYLCTVALSIPLGAVIDCAVSACNFSPKRLQ